MPKLHEILAVEGDLAGTAKRLMDEARDTFGKKPHHFQAETAVTNYFDEAKAHLNTTTQTAMTTTVGDKLSYVAEHLARYYDAYATKERTNQEAAADVTLPDGKVFMTGVPATVLLGMETKLKELRSVYEAIPTLQPGIEWEPEPEAGKGVYQSKHGEVRFVTEKTMVPIELSPATKEHKAQVQAITQDIPVAKREITSLSGMVTPATKSDLIGRVDTLIRAVKEARQRANGVDAKPMKIGASILAYINGDVA